MTEGRDGSHLPWEANFRTAMREERERLGMSQTELARRLRDDGLGFHQQTIARIESGDRPLRLDEAQLIALELQVPLDEMTAPRSGPGWEVESALSDWARDRLDLGGAASTYLRSQHNLDRAAKAAAEAGLDDYVAVVEDALAETPERIVQQQRELVADNRAAAEAFADATRQARDRRKRDLGPPVGAPVDDRAWHVGYWIHDVLGNQVRVTLGRGAHPEPQQKEDRSDE